MRVAKFAAMLLASFLFGACGGGGDGGSPGTSPVGTSTASGNTPGASSASFPLQSAFRAYVTAGGMDFYNVSGSCNGTAVITRLPPSATTFEGVPAQRVVGAQNTAFSDCPNVSATGEDFYDADFRQLGSASSGAYGVLLPARLALPDSVRVGDTAVGGAATVYPDASKASVIGRIEYSFKVEADTASTAIVNLIAKEFDSANRLQSTTQSRYRLRASGALEPVSIDIQSAVASSVHLLYKLESSGMIVPGGASTPSGGGQAPAPGTNTSFLARQALFDTPTALAYDAASNVFYIASGKGGIVRKLTASGTVSTIAGSYPMPDPAPPGGADGPGAVARFTRITGLTVGSDRNIYLTDAEDATTSRGRIRRIAVGDNSVSTILSSAYSEGITADGNGNLFFTRNVDGGVDRTTVAGGSSTRIATLTGARGITVDNAGNLYVGAAHPDFAPLSYHVVSCLIEKIATDGTASILAGALAVPTVPDSAVTTCGFSDAAGSASRVNTPQGIAVGPDGSVYFADSANHVIRRAGTDGTVTTFAGVPGGAGWADGSGASARFNRPLALAFGADGYLYVADSGNHVIRRISPAGAVETIAGQPGVAGNADG